MITPIKFVLITIAVITFVVAFLIVGVYLEKLWFKIKRVWWSIKHFIRLTYKWWRLQRSMKRTIEMLEKNDKLNPEARMEMQKITKEIKNITKKNNKSRYDG